MLALQYGNSSDLVPDPSVFDIPCYCYCMSPVQDKPAVQNKPPVKSKVLGKLERVCAPAQFESKGLGVIAQQVQGKGLTTIDIVFQTFKDYKKQVEASITDLTFAGKPFRSVFITDWKLVSFFLLQIHFLV